HLTKPNFYPQFSAILATGSPRRALFSDSLLVTADHSGQAGVPRIIVVTKSTQNLPAGQRCIGRDLNALIFMRRSSFFQKVSPIWQGIHISNKVSSYSHIAFLLPLRATIPLLCLQAITLFNSTFWRCLRILIPIYYPAMISGLHEPELPGF
ncbi:hypothetical protein, partial [Endozoicomonas sp. YOMI1]|uniref:hypothetical protein n=1 Tax=Endozoicomonas sp. YOMI1 TaxID=2828739 RepID=UPI0021481435